VDAAGEDTGREDGGGDFVLREIFCTEKVSGVAVARKADPSVRRAPAKLRREGKSAGLRSG
jgi:hypothetical protein